MQRSDRLTHDASDSGGRVLWHARRGPHMDPANEGETSVRFSMLHDIVRRFQSLCEGATTTFWRRLRLICLLQGTVQKNDDRRVRVQGKNRLLWRVFRCLL